MKDIQQFQKYISAWSTRNRRDFPWRETFDPYKIWISELMLQQTQTDRVVPKYKAFLEQFPTVFDLSCGTQADVLKMWQGLGYNRRAQFAHKASKVLVENCKGIFPKSTDELEKLPGIGPYTARAVATFAYNSPEVFIETNIRSVYLYHFFHDTQEKVSDKELLPIIKESLDCTNPREWYYSLMDYGSVLKKLVGNSNKQSRHYTKQTKFEGSDREVRGYILKQLTTGNEISLENLSIRFPQKLCELPAIVEKLHKEQLICVDKTSISLYK